MKIAIVTAYPPSKITLNEYAYHLVKQFRVHKKISEVILLTDKTRAPKEINFEEKGCPISVEECWSFNSYTNLVNITQALNKTKPDAVLFNLQFMKFGDQKVPAALGLMLPLVCKLKKIPSIVLLHNIMEQVDLASAGFTKNPLLQKVYGLIGSGLTRLILQADTVAVTIAKYVESLENKYDVNNVKLIPHGTFEVPEEPNYEQDEELLKIMTFGKFGTYKKIENMIEAVEIVRNKTGKKLEIVIAGTDNPNVPGYLEDVKKRYAHVRNLVFTGYVEEHEVPILFRESAMVVFPYTSTTGSSGVLHQAGSYGKAVVMPNLGDLKRLVEDEGYRGSFFEANSIESLSVAIETLVTNPAIRDRIARANYKAATAHPMSDIANRYVNTFEEIIAAKQTQKPAVKALA